MYLADRPRRSRLDAILAMTPIQVAQRSEELFQQGFCCAESVLQAIAESRGIKSELIPKIATGLCGAAMGTMLGAFVKSASQANGLSIMLGMVMALLGGCWYPQEIIPEGVRTILQIVPTTWAMRGLTDLVARGLGLPAILPSAAILVAFAAVFFVVGIARFRYE